MIEQEDVWMFVWFWLFWNDVDLVLVGFIDCMVVMVVVDGLNCEYVLFIFVEGQFGVVCGEVDVFILQFSDGLISILFYVMIIVLGWCWVDGWVDIVVVEIVLMQGE